jgi:hypothetical protein
VETLKFSHLWVGNMRPAIGAYFNRLQSRPSFNVAIQGDEIPLPMLLAGLRRIFFGI